jgi:hypothetical protein
VNGLRDADEGRVPPGDFVRLGFLIVSLVDATVAVALSDAELRATTLAWQVAYATGHLIFIGFVVGMVADAGARLLPQNAAIRGLAAALVAAATASFVLREDYSVFEAHIRVPLTVASALPFAAVAAAAPRLTQHRVLGFASLALGSALAFGNAFVLEGGYAGLHLSASIAAGVLAGLGLRGVAPALDLRGRAPAVGWALAAVVAAASVATRPRNVVVVALSRHPTASLMTFLSRSEERLTYDVPSAPVDQAEWFADRSGIAPIPPTTPALHPQPVVIFLTIDALRADLVLDESQEATKHLRAMARGGALFTDAHSVASATSPSLGAIFAGKYYSSLYWTEAKTGGGKVKYFLDEEDTPRWPELLEGVQRILVRRKGGVDSQEGLVRGFEETTAVISWADQIVDQIAGILCTAGDGPLLVYSHLLDPHFPYTSRGEIDDPFQGYLAEVAFVDAEIARLQSIVAKEGLEDRTFFIITADHGEAFGEHRTKYHAKTVYEELVHVPLIVAGPGVVKRRIEEPVSTMDLGPTILDLFGEETPGSFMGQSLVPLLGGEDVRLTRPIVIDTGRRKQALIGRDGVKVIRNLNEKTVELYDLRTDPKELVNLVDERPELAEERLGLLGAFFDVHELKRPGYQIPSRD